MKQSALEAGLKTLAESDLLATSVSFFSDSEIEALRIEANALPMRKAKDRVGKYSVHQDFEICFPAPRKGAIDELAKILEEGVKASAYINEKNFELNDVAVQRYPNYSQGIGVHRDALGYRGVVFIITLEGDSRFCVCEDRDGKNPKRIDDSPGKLTLLSAPGFNGH